MEFHFETNQPMETNSSTSRKAKKILDSLDDGLIYDTPRLASKLNLTPQTIRGIATELPTYTTKSKTRRVWGNPKTIEEFIKQYGE